MLLILKERQPNIVIYLLGKLQAQMKNSCPPHTHTKKNKKSKQNKEENQHLAKILGSKDRKPRGQSSKAPGMQSDNTDCGKFYKTKGQGYLSNNYMGGEGGNGIDTLRDSVGLPTPFSEGHYLGNKKYNFRKVSVIVNSSNICKFDNVKESV